MTAGFERLQSRLAGYLPMLVWLLAITFCAWVCASLFWAFAGPGRLGTQPRPETDPRKAAQQIVQALGGHTSQTATAAVAPPARYSLIGLATGFGDKPGFALLHTEDGQTLPLLLDESTADGLRLVTIHADRIELERDGRRQELRLASRPDNEDDRDEVASAPPPPAHALPPAGAPAAPPPAAGPPAFPRSND